MENMQKLNNEKLTRDRAIAFTRLLGMLNIPAELIGAVIIFKAVELFKEKGSQFSIKDAEELIASIQIDPEYKLPTKKN